jgi:hypothetical protein
MESKSDVIINPNRTSSAVSPISGIFLQLKPVTFSGNMTSEEFDLRCRQGDGEILTGKVGRHY